jgi:hypothetical protein
MVLKHYLNKLIIFVKRMVLIWELTFITSSDWNEADNHA